MDLLLSARVRRDGGAFGPAFDHMCLRVRAGDEDWLADVGFGESFRRPFILDAGEPHREGRISYALRRAGDELERARREGDGPWEPQYRLDLVARRLEEFAPMSEFHQTSPEAPFTRRRVCTRATSSGRLTLTDHALVRTTLAGERTEVPLQDEAAWGEALGAHFDIERDPLHRR